MERLALNDATMGKCVSRAADVLRQRGAILYPTDTLYGLGADAFSDEAVDKVYALKGRDEKKPIHCIVADLEMAEHYAEFSDDSLLLAKTFFPGPLTLVLPKRPDLETGIGRRIATIGIRIPENGFCLALAKMFGKPFTATSANASGQTPQRSIDNILAQLVHSQKVAITTCIDTGTLPERRPSTVVECLEGEITILREGAIPAADIWNTIRAEP